MSYLIRQYFAILVLALAVVPMVQAESSSDELQALQQQLEALKQQMQQMQDRYQAQIRALEQRFGELESQSTEQTVALPAASPPPSASPQAVSGTGAGSGFQIGLSGLFAAGGSSANNDELEGLHG